MKKTRVAVKHLVVNGKQFFVVKNGSSESYLGMNDTVEGLNRVERRALNVFLKRAAKTAKKVIKAKRAA